MENIVQNELLNNARKILELKNEFAPSYNEQRTNALKFFEEKGIPTKKEENWLYTNIAKYLSPRFVTSASEKNLEKEYVIDSSKVLIFNNGFFNRNQSVLPDGITKSAPKNTNTYHDSFDALNQVCAVDSISFKVAKNTTIESPVTILHLVDELGVNKQSTPRIHFFIEENVNITFVEVFTSAQNDLFQYTTNAHTSFTVGKNSHVKHVKLNIEAKHSTHISLTKADLYRDSSFKTYSFDLGNIVTRNNLEVHLHEENANAHVHGLFNLKQSEHADVFSGIYHHSPNTFSDQVYKGILNHTSHGAFTGKVEIDKDAIGVNAAQLNKNLLLSKKAHINTRPQLLVAADDVKCAHGATVGELSKEEEFYLMSRGISKDKARKMQAIGFAHEVLFKVEDQKIFNFVHKFLEKIEYTLWI